jgi:hypothetical protein
LRALIKGEWWLDGTALRTDTSGRVVIQGFLGTYQLSATGEAIGFELGHPGRMSVDVVLPSQPTSSVLRTATVILTARGSSSTTRTAWP